MQRKFASIAALAVILVIVAGINLIASLLFQRAKIDATEDKLFTLSQGSRNIAAALPEHVTAKFFFSKTAVSNNPALRAYAARIVDLLGEYRAASHGRLAVEQIDPRPDTEEEEAANRLGMQGVQIPSVEGSLYIGLAVRDDENPDQIVPIPFFDPSKENLLEYDISKALYSVAHTEKKRVGIMSSLPVMGGPARSANPMAPPPQGQRPWYFVQQLKENFDVVEVSPTASELPKKLDLLVVVHPKKFSQTAQYLIDQFLLGGGSVIAFIDPLSAADMMATSQTSGGNMQAMMQAEFDSNLPDLLKAWGLELVSSDPQGPQASAGGGPSPKVVADMKLAESVNTRTGATDQMVVWLKLGKDQMDPQSVITNGLSHVTLVEAGALKRTGEQEGVTASVLMKTAEDASLMDAMMLKFSTDPASLRSKYKPGGSELTLAYKLSGKFKTAYPGGKPAAAAAEGETPAAAASGEHLAESKSDGTVIVVADSDMLADPYCVNLQNFFGRQIATPANDNLIFAANAVENLSGSKDLIALRSRGRSQRPFTRVEAMLASKQAQAQKQEDALTEEIQAAAQELNQLAAGTKDTKVLDRELVKKQKEIREKQILAKQRLRDLRRGLREDVERMGVTLQFANIVLMPLIVIGVGLTVAVLRTSRRRRRS